MSMGAVGSLEPNNFKMNLRSDTTLMKTSQLQKPVFLESRDQFFRASLQDWVEDTTDLSSPKSKKVAESRILFALDNYAFNLDLSQLNLRSLPPFFGLLFLENLSLSGNKLDVIEEDAFWGLKALRELDLSFNSLSNIRNVDFYGNLFLKSLDLSNNVFESYVGLPDFSSLPHLSSLSLVNNFLTSFSGFDVSKCSYLSYLNFENNCIKSLEGLNLLSNDKLCYLNLSKNQLRDISPLNLSDCSSLTKLRLEFNQLLAVDCRLPQNLSSTLDIYVEGNLFSLMYMEYLNSQQSFGCSSKYRYFFSPFQFSGVDVKLDDIFPVLVQWRKNPFHVLWQKISLADSRSVEARNYLNFILFFGNLYQDTFDNRDFDVRFSIQNLVKMVLDNLENLYPCDDLLTKCCLIAEENVSSCVDKMIIGLLQLSIQVKLEVASRFNDRPVYEKWIREQTWIQRVASFVYDVHVLKIVYDYSKDRFLDLSSVSKEKFYVDGVPYGVDDMSLSDRQMILSKRRDEGKPISAFQILDQVEDILILINRLKPEDVSSINGVELFHSTHASFNQTCYKKAAISYLRSRYSS